MKRTIKFLLFCLLCSTWARSQGWFESHPLSISMGKESTSIPFYNTFTGPYQPAIAASVEFSHSEGSHGKLFQTINLGWFTSKFSHQGAHLSTFFGYRYRLGFGLFMDAAIELGIQQSFHKRAIFERNETGFAQVRDKGTLFGLAGGNVSVGYNIGSSEHQLDLFVAYRQTVLLPYPDIDVLPQEFVSIGTRFTL
ncbi:MULTISPECIES: hypothetical protein [Flavobacteriaceae]|uniref:hypothetical protein n=1 Tax=Flavobacteriaceae TaxID=49546 RepID=UPI001492B309|nr:MULTISPECIES: hypothetical protein [Allomuricauda]MDC6366971.1 hypothetical protein [Muricauda sp. AC10]